MTHTVSGGDYASLACDQQTMSPSPSRTTTRLVTVRLVAPTSLMVDEGSSTDTYTVVLDTLPTGDVTVAIGSDNIGRDRIPVQPDVHNDQPGALSRR